MSDLNKSRGIKGGFGIVFILFFIGLVLLLRSLLQDKNVALLNPKGIIADEQYKLMIYSAVILLSIAIPAVLLLYFMAWKYRESNTKAKYIPNQKHGRFFVLKLWLIPSLFIVVLAFVMFPATHRLDPRKSIDSEKDTMKIQVISLRWKWLFIYPEEGIATVNYVQIPVDTPVEFEMTADQSPMSSFWIPNLGGQLYAMTSHINRLNLMAETPGDYPGSTPEITGEGFAGMRFIARASDHQDFDNWVESAKQSPEVLDTDSYKELVQPSENNPQVIYSAYQQKLFETVVAKYHESGGHSH